MTIKAIYHDGILELLEPLPLEENQKVEIELTPLSTSVPEPGSLFGAFPELAALTTDDLEWAKRLWEHSAEKQSRILDGLS